MENLFNDYGISFPRRILYAFHTSFKIANWSTLTVLAGVSGTGKSELPRLYSAFGGFNFITVPVQPNWDSQDETTKSLSDKVLDRGIVINFPRPRELKSRKGAFSLESFCAEKNIFPMNVALWESWRENSIKLQGDQLKKLESYRHLLEMMNEHLSHAGRAIGHRVWQSIEHYVINYPTVRTALNAAGSDLTGELTEAVRIAVEDQIVQKVMPKLRGIETRGKSYEKCLVPIRGLLNDSGFNLNDDFDRACEMGYGQFMWNSAEYIGNAAEPENGNDK